MGESLAPSPGRWQVNAPIRRSISMVAWAAVIAMLVFQLTYVWTSYGVIGGRILHMWFAVIVAALISFERSPTWPKLVLSLVAVITSSWASFYYYNDQLGIFSRYGFGSDADLIFGGILVLWMLIYVGEFFGSAFVAIGLVFIAYAFLGSYMPEPLTSPKQDPSIILSKLTVGSLGNVVELSASIIFLIMLFGALLRSSGAGEFIWQVSRVIVQRVGGGGGAVAVSASALVATFTGVGAANVGITGPITIPMMKRDGYTASEAAAIEALASTAGQITPPILGLVAFLMADFLGISYTTIAFIAIIPASLYYFGLMSHVILAYRKRAMKAAPVEIDPVPKAQFIKSGIAFLLPLTLMVFLLDRGYSVAYTAFWAIIAIVAIGIALRLERSPRVWIESIKSGVVQGASIALAAGILDLVLTSLNVTQLGMLMGFVVSELGGGNTLVTFLLVILASYVLGMGMPGIAVYTVLAITLVPVLTNLGTAPIVAHFILMYMIILAYFTPPVAPTIVLTSRIADAPFIRSGIDAMRVGAGAMMLPFFLFANHQLLFQNVTAFGLARALFVAGASIFIAQVALVGWFRRPFTMPTRFILFALAVGIWIGEYSHSEIVVWLCIAAGAAFLAPLREWVAARGRA